MSFVLYNLALLVLTPAVAAYIFYRVFISRKSRSSWRQQFGDITLPPEIADRRRIWVHAVSVGESVAAGEVVAELKRLLPDAAVVVSTTTETGQEMAHKSAKDADAFFYYPFDLLPSVGLALSRVRPVVYASTDTEMWPNLLHVAHARGVKTAVLNGTVSDRTMGGARRIPWIYRWMMRNIDRFLMQSQADAERVISLGADPARVMVTGNCKADQAAVPVSEDERAELRRQLGVAPEAKVLVAGSTNPGEDGPVIEAFLIAREQHPSLRLIIAPRQVERRDEIRAIADAKGLACGWRSDASTIRGAEDLIILDSFGELARIYAIADVTFVGGSLVPRGCHSILQPISQGKPVLHGPYTFKARDLIAQAATAGVGFEVRNAAELGRLVSEMLADTALLEEIRGRCNRMMDSNLGASKRTATALAELIGEAAVEPGQ